MEPARSEVQGQAGAARQALTALLARRETSTADARQRLADKGHAPEHIEATIAQFQRAGLLDDERFARHYVDFHGSRGDGPLRLRDALRKLGLTAAQIDGALETDIDWAQRCRETRQRKFGAAMPATSKDKGRQARFLQYRGFSADHIGSALGYHLQLQDE